MRVDLYASIYGKCYFNIKKSVKLENDLLH